MAKVLIVEDNVMLADMMNDLLVEHGYEVCGVAGTVANAVELGRRHAPDLAVIDVRLAGGDSGTEIALQLGDLKKLGILYVTGNISRVILTGAIGHACLAKPYLDADLLRSLELVADIVATGTAPPPFPQGFSILQAGPIPASGVFG